MMRDKRNALYTMVRRSARPGVMVATLASIVAATHAPAQEYPVKPIRIVTPFTAASTTDILARALGQRFTSAWGQPVIVDNRAGAGGNVAGDFVAKSPPDGYTLLLGTNGTNAINASLYKNIPYDTLRDFAPVVLIVTSHLLLVVHPSLPVRSVRELIALAKSRPGELTFGSGGSGTTPHLAGELFKTLTGVNMVHVPYKGSPQSTLDLLAGRIDMIFASSATSLPLVKAGKLRILAMSAAKRDPALPDVPTISEAGVRGFAASPWFGLFAPAATPAAIVAKLNAETTRMLAGAETKAYFEGFGLAAAGGTPEQFAAYVRSEVEKWAKVVRASGARVD